MKIKLFLASWLSVMLPFTAYADVTLHFSNSVELLTFNGQIHQTSTFGPSEPVTLENGTQQITFRYVASIGNGSDISLVKTDVIVIKFDASNNNIYFSFPDITSKKQTRDFNENPHFTLLDGNDNQIAFTQGKLLKKGFQLSRDYLSELQRFNLTVHPASFQNTSTEPTLTFENNGPKVVVGETIRKDEAEYQLHYWYQHANKDTKERFKAFINAN